MGKLQTRRSISLRGTTHARVLAHCEAVGCSVSSYLEGLIAADLGPVAAPPRSALDGLDMTAPLRGKEAAKARFADAKENVRRREPPRSHARRDAELTALPPVRRLTAADRAAVVAESREARKDWHRHTAPVENTPRRTIAPSNPPAPGPRDGGDAPEPTRAASPAAVARRGAERIW